MIKFEPIQIKFNLIEIMRLHNIIILFFIIHTNSLIGQNDTTTVCYSRYQHLVVNYNSNYLKYTSMYEGCTAFEFLFRDFKEFENRDDLACFFTNGRQCKQQYRKDPELDTINTVNWYNGLMPQTHINSVVFYKKIYLSYILYKFGEKRLSEDSIKSIRLLLPDDYMDGQGKWYLYSVLFYKDSTIIYAKRSDVIDTIGRQTIHSVSKKLKLREEESLLKNIELLEESPGFECFPEKYYPFLLEYYDGYAEHCYIFSNKCKLEKDLEKQYGRLILKILNFAPNGQHVTTN